MQSLGFVNEEGYLLNGAVLFLDDYNERKTEVQCSVFSGFNKGSERIVTINKFNGNITSTIEYIMDSRSGKGHIIDMFPCKQISKKWHLHLHGRDRAL